MEQLKNITKTGAPESRLNDSKAVLSMVHDLIELTSLELRSELG